MNKAPIVALAAILFAATAGAETRSTRLSEVIVTAPRSVLSEEQPIGATGRPEWTSARRFTTTRVYIQKEPWEIGFEQWVRTRRFRDESWGHLFQEEIELGLPYRMQLDLYYDWEADDHRHTRFHDVGVELRYALADWGKIPLNPTLYAEYKFVNANEGGDVFEFKLLLGQELLPRLHWGLNAVYEQELSGSKTTEWQVTQGISYTVIDGFCSVGAEMKYVREDAGNVRGDEEHKFLVGPSIQFRPTRNTHLDFVALFGTNEHAPEVEGYIVFGVDFGKVGGSDSHQYQPVSLRSN
jgi:hypothetical protein